MKTIVIVGGSSRIAEECAKKWLQQEPCCLILIGKDLSKLSKIQNDLMIRFSKSMIEIFVVDFFSVHAIQECVQSICNQFTPELVFIAQGLLTPQLECQNNLMKTQEMLLVNGNSVILFAEAFISFFEKQHKGHLAIIGSVAGDRTRKSNYIYGATKGLVEKYVQGLQHRFALNHIKITLIKPGPTDTPMTTEFKKKGMKLAPVNKVADEIVQGINHNKRVLYTPGHWRYVMMVIRMIPFFIFKKIDI